MFAEFALKWKWLPKNKLKLNNSPIELPRFDYYGSQSNREENKLNKEESNNDKRNHYYIQNSNWKVVDWQLLEPVLLRSATHSNK